MTYLNAESDKIGYRIVGPTYRAGAHPLAGLVYIAIVTDGGVDTQVWETHPIRQEAETWAFNRCLRHCEWWVT